MTCGLAYVSIKTSLQSEIKSHLNNVVILFSSQLNGFFAGDHRGVVTPVPIPNTEVKGPIAEGSAGLARARVGRRRLFFCCRTPASASASRTRVARGIPPPCGPFGLGFAEGDTAFFFCLERLRRDKRDERDPRDGISVGFAPDCRFSNCLAAEGLRTMLLLPKSSGYHSAQAPWNIVAYVPYVPCLAQTPLTPQISPILSCKFDIISLRRRDLP